MGYLESRNRLASIEGGLDETIPTTQVHATIHSDSYLQGLFKDRPELQALACMRLLSAKSFIADDISDPILAENIPPRASRPIAKQTQTHTHGQTHNHGQTHTHVQTRPQTQSVQRHSVQSAAAAGLPPAISRTTSAEKTTPKQMKRLVSPTRMRRVSTPHTCSPLKGSLDFSPDAPKGDRVRQSSVFRRLRARSPTTGKIRSGSMGVVSSSKMYTSPQHMGETSPVDLSPFLSPRNGEDIHSLGAGHGGSGSERERDEGRSPEIEEEYQSGQLTHRAISVLQPTEPCVPSTAERLRRTDRHVTDHSPLRRPDILDQADELCLTSFMRRSDPNVKMMPVDDASKPSFFGINPAATSMSLVCAVDESTMAPKTYEGLHLIVFVHGFQGNGLDMRLLKNAISCVNPEAVLFVSTANEGKTEECLLAQGQRLADVRETRPVYVNCVCSVSVYAGRVYLLAVCISGCVYVGFVYVGCMCCRRC